MSEPYYKPCRELELCNELIEKYFNTQQYEKCFEGHSALAAVAAFRGATWGMILYTADSLADVDKYDQRNWGGNAYEYALTLCLDAVLKL